MAVIRSCHCTKAGERNSQAPIFPKNNATKIFTIVPTASNQVPRKRICSAALPLCGLIN